MAKKTTTKTVTALKHDEATRKNNPTAEYQSVLQKAEQNPVRVAYERRNRDLDPQLVWRGKDEQDWSDLVVHAPPLYIQEKVYPKALIDDLQRVTTRETVSFRTYRIGQRKTDSILCVCRSAKCRERLTLKYVLSPFTIHRSLFTEPQ